MFELFLLFSFEARPLRQPFKGPGIATTAGPFYSNAPRIPPIQLESLLRHLEVIYYDCFLLSKSFSRFGLFGAVLVRFGGLLGRSWGNLVGLLMHLGATWGPGVVLSLLERS